MENISAPIKKCRVCGSEKLIPILSLGNQYLSNFIDDSEKEYPKSPLDLVLCAQDSGGCGLLQLEHTASSQVLYKQYWYFSGVNQTMRDALADITEKVKKLINLSDGDLVIDIGSNDGTLLKSYGKKGLLLVGFEPAENLIEKASEGATKIINEFFNYKSLEESFGNKPAKVITAIAMFYDLDDPNAFVADIARCLDKNGLFVIQMSYLPAMLKQNAFDNICHEHLEYYSLMSLKNLLERHNLEIFDVELNDVNGGSFRTYIKHKDCNSIAPFKGAASRLKKLEKYEKSLCLQKREVYDEFAERVNGIKQKVFNFIKNETEKGKTVYVYGASTKGNVLLQFFNLDHNLIKAAAERNPIKWGKKTVGTLIPIISEEQARAAKPDYFLLLPWHFLEEFKKREKDFLNAGGKFIIPLPEFKII